MISRAKRRSWSTPPATVSAQLKSLERSLGEKLFKRGGRNLVLTEIGHLVLTYADASTDPGKTTADSDIVEARFIDIVPGVRVVQAVTFVADDPDLAGTMTMTWEVTATHEGTRMDIRAEQVPDGISAEDHAAGLASSLANLAGYVESYGRSWLE